MGLKATYVDREAVAQYVHWVLMRLRANLAPPETLSTKILLDPQARCAANFDLSALRTPTAESRKDDST